MYLVKCQCPYKCSLNEPSASQIFMCDICIYCLEDIKNAHIVILQCGHIFHDSCVKKALKYEEIQLIDIIINKFKTITSQFFMYYLIKEIIKNDNYNIFLETFIDNLINYIINNNNNMLTKTIILSIVYVEILDFLKTKFDTFNIEHIKCVTICKKILIDNYNDFIKI